MRQACARCIVVVVGALLWTLPAAAMDEECIEYDLSEPRSAGSNSKAELVIEDPDFGTAYRHGWIDEIYAGDTVRFRIVHDAVPAGQIVVDVQLLGNGDATLTRPDTGLQCRQMRWLVTLVDANDEIVMTRDVFAVELGPSTVIDKKAARALQLKKQPRWKQGDTLMVKIGREFTDRRHAVIRWDHLAEVALYPEQPLTVE